MNSTNSPTSGSEAKVKKTRRIPRLILVAAAPIAALAILCFLAVVWQAWFGCSCCRNNPYEARRNAQDLVSVYGAAVAAGASIDTSSLDRIIESLQTGVNGTGDLSSKHFIFRRHQKDIDKLKKYIDTRELASEGVIMYEPRYGQ